MPTYEYACEACGNEWEAEQRITENALKDCPKCGEPKARRLISGSRFLLKGGGWYETDFKSDGETKRNLVGKEETESKSEDKKPDSTTDSAKTETKPEAKPESTPSVKSATKAKPAKTTKPKPKAKPAAKKRR